MNATPPKNTRRPLLLVLAAIVAVVIIVAAYMVFGPGPTDFAGGKRVALAAYTAGDPTGVPAELKSASQIERGEYLTRAADCEVCHTAKDGAPFAGGVAFVLPFGAIYSTNITPDAQTGIGNYSDANFLDAVHKGIGRNNTKLYPAMPYTSYTYMSDADALAIKAYLFTLKPVHAPAPKNLNNRQKFAGAVQAGWRAYNITPHHASGVGSWSDADLAHYLSAGHADGRGTAAGPMGEAIDASLSYLKGSDIAAIVTYLRSVPNVATAGLPDPRQTPAPALFADTTPAAGESHGKAVYEGACAGCHGWTGVSPVIPFATLTGTRGVNDASAINVAQVIIGGGHRHVAGDSNNMPAFGSTYSDAEIASVANYVTARFGAKGSDLTAAEVAKLRAEE